MVAYAAEGAACEPLVTVDLASDRAGRTRVDDGPWRDIKVPGEGRDMTCPGVFTRFGAVRCGLCRLGAAAVAAIFPVAAMGAPVLMAPADGEVVSLSIPSFRWRAPATPAPGAMLEHDIEIATDRAFERVVDADRLAAVISWYVPDQELAPGPYWWRVARVDAAGVREAWSAARTFTVRPPERVVRVARGATFADIQAAFARAATQTPARVEFEVGDYRLDPDDTRTFIAFRDVDDLVIDGGGARIVLTHPAGWIDLQNCRRVLVKNFTFDFDPPAYTAGRVVAVDPVAGWIETEILSGHALPTDWPAFDRDRKGMVVSEPDGFAIKRGAQLVLPHAGFDHRGGRRFRFRFENASLTGQFFVGDIYVLDPRWGPDGGGHGAFVGGGEDVVFLNLTLRGAANECLGSFYADRHAILHVNLERGPGRALSVNNGGNNHHNARTGPWIEGCRFENCGDDVCHVNGYAMSAEAQPAPDRLVISLHQPYDQYGRQAGLDVRAGDRLVFYQRSAGRRLAEARVVAAALGAHRVEVVVDHAITGIGTGRLRPTQGAAYAASGNPEVTEIYNASRMCNQFVFRHNLARNSRRIGVLAKGNGGLIEHNAFAALGGGGVEFWNAPFEGLAAENYVVRHNRIVGCGRLTRRHAAIWATIFQTGGDRLHRNLLIAENQITGFSGPAIDLADTQDAVVRGNRIVTADPNPVMFSNTANVSAENNPIRGSEP